MGIFSTFYYKRYSCFAPQISIGVNLAKLVPHATQQKNVGDVQHIKWLFSTHDCSLKMEEEKKNIPLNVDFVMSLYFNFFKDHPEI